MQNQDVKIYDNMVDVFVSYGNSIYVSCPKGIFRTSDILKKFWFKVKESSKIELPQTTMIREMWLKPAIVAEDGNVCIKMGEDGWAHTGFVIVSKDE